MVRLPSSGLKITSGDIIKVLKRNHKSHLWCEELRLSSGFGQQGRIDFWALNPAPSSGCVATSYEVKVSKSDFKRDTYGKQRGARLISDYFFYAAPEGMIDPKDIPDWAGLLEFKWRVTSTRRVMMKRVRLPAPKRDKDQPSWGLVSSIIRNTNTYGGAL